MTQKHFPTPTSSRPSQAQHSVEAQSSQSSWCTRNRHCNIIYSFPSWNYTICMQKRHLGLVLGNLIRMLANQQSVASERCAHKITKISTRLETFDSIKSILSTTTTTALVSGTTWNMSSPLGPWSVDRKLDHTGDKIETKGACWTFTA